jgi:hypothetical protein
MKTNTDSMSKKERFVLFVYLNAIARDLSRAQTESENIGRFATRIPEKQIPANAMNAAMVYIAYLDGRSRPFNWMFCGPRTQAAKAPPQPLRQAA